MISSAHLRCAAAAAIGFALTTAHPLGIASAILMPALALSQPTRRMSWAAAVSYYAGALWPIIPGANNFFGPDVSAIGAVVLWAFSGAALASVWPLMWSSDRRQALWRSSVALLLTVTPPLGIIGFASPLTAAGFLFPGAAWCGLLVCAIFSGALAAYPRMALLALAALAVPINMLHRNPEPLRGWQGIDTNFGPIAQGDADPVVEYRAAEWIQERSLSADAKVIVFPETVVPAWTAATEAFWQQTLARLRASGKTILLGARIPAHYQISPQQTYDFSADLAALETGLSDPFPPVRRSLNLMAEFAYDNAVMIRGAENADFLQRIPVPFAMWKPFQSHGARLNMFGPGVIRIDGQRAAVLICYELLITWPALASFVDNPTVLIAVANDHWATGTPIHSFQLAAVGAWSRLFGVPAVTATNR